MLALTLLASGAATGERNDDGCLAANSATAPLYPWRFNPEYVPDEESEPELFAVWEADLTTVGFRPRLDASGGVWLNSDQQPGASNTTAPGSSRSAELSAPPYNETGAPPASLSAPVPAQVASSTVPETFNMEKESASAGIVETEEANTTEEVPTTSTAPEQPETDYSMIAEVESSSDVPPVVESSSEAVVEESASEPVREVEESSSAVEVEEAEKEELAPQWTEAIECMNPDDVEDAGRVFLGSDWTGTNTQVKKVKKYRKFLEKEYKEVGAWPLTVFLATAGLKQCGRWRCCSGFSSGASCTSIVRLPAVDRRGVAGRLHP